MAKIDFTYSYPYPDYSNKFAWDFSESRITMNGNYSYPAEFKVPLPKCSQFSFSTSVENTGSSSVLGISWDVYVYTTSWIKVGSFTMPADGEYTFDGTLNNLNIKKFLMIPSSRLGSGRTWNISYSVESFTITESLDLNELQAGMFQYGVFPNRAGVKQRLNELFVNVNGSLISPTKIFINMDDELKPLQDVLSSHLQTTSESTTLYSFAPTETGKYRIQQKKLSGNHEIRLYDSSFNLISENYFYQKSFDMTQGSLFYVTVTHYCGAQTSESYLQIYKED